MAERKKDRDRERKYEQKWAERNQDRKKIIWTKIGRARNRDRKKKTWTKTVRKMETEKENLNKVDCCICICDVDHTWLRNIINAPNVSPSILFAENRRCGTHTVLTTPPEHSWAQFKSTPGWPCVNTMDIFAINGPYDVFHGNEVIPKETTHFIQRPCYQLGSVRAKIQQAIEPHEDLLTIVKRRKLQWYVHVSRSPGQAKTILQGTVKWGRRQDR